MKKQIFISVGMMIVVYLSLSSKTIAQAPDAFKFQAIARDLSGEVLSNQAVTLQISILQGNVTGSSVYVETFSVSTNNFGLVNITIGEGDVESGDITKIDWASGAFFLKLALDDQGGTNYNEIGTSQLLSVPYALHAKTVDHISIDGSEDAFTNWDKDKSNDFSGSYSDLEGAPDLSDTAEYLTEESQSIGHVLTQGNDGDAKQIKNIADPTDNQDVATKKYVDNLEDQISSLKELLAISGMILRDYDGNYYKTVTIGNQVWMAENLRVTHFSDGTPISKVEGQANWGSLLSSDTAYCWYDDDSTTYAQSYGALYTWTAATNGEGSSVTNPSGIQGVCPDGWHLPSDAEWTELNDFIANDGHSGNEGTAIKATSGWDNNGNGTDNYNFSALPAGFRNDDGYSQSLGEIGGWWSCTELQANIAYDRTLFYAASWIATNTHFEETGFTVRCIKD